MREPAFFDICHELSAIIRSYPPNMAFSATCLHQSAGLRLLRLRGGLMDAQRICTSIDCETMTYQAVVYFGQEARHRNICFGLRDHEKFKTVEVRVVCAASPSIMDQVTDRMNPYQPRLAPTGVGLPWDQPGTALKAPGSGSNQTHLQNSANFTEKIAQRSIVFRCSSHVG